MVTVTKLNFLEESNSLIQKLPSAAFISIDLEMTGVATPNSTRPNKSDSPPERYAKMKEIPERYNIIQVGIAVFHENPKFKRYVKKKVGEIYTAHEEVEEDDDENDENNDGNDDENDEDDDDMDIDRKIHNHISLEDIYGTRQVIDRIVGSRRQRRHCHFRDLDDSNVQPDSNTGESASNSQNAVNDNENGSSGLNPSNADGQGINNEENQAQEQNGSRNVGSNGGGDDDNNGSDDSDDDQYSDGHDEDVLNDGDDSTDSDNSIDGSNDDPNQDQEPPEFLVYKYNFYLFPSPHSTRHEACREVTMNPASIAFLIEQEMNFREWIVNGIPYTTLDNANLLLKHFHSRYEKEREEKEKLLKEKLGNSPPPPLHQDLYEPNEPNEVAFIARSMANLREWIDSAAPPMRNIDGNMSIDEEERLGIVKLLPPHKKENLRNCLFRKIKSEYPSLHWYKHNSKNYVLRLSEEEKKKRDERIKRVEWQKIHKDVIGFTRVFKAISDACCGQLGDTDNLNGEYKQFLQRSENHDLSLTSNTSNRRRVPLVVHNGYLDLLFLLTHFHSRKLPSSHTDAKKLIHDYFPIIYDTKVLATECADCRFRSKNSSLAELYQRHVMGLQNTNDHDNDMPMRFDYPRVEIMNDLTTSTSRDAGDDAFMTGAVFQCISRPMINHIAIDEFDPFDDRTALYIEMVEQKIDGVGSLLFLDEKYSTKIDSDSYFGMNKIFLPHSIFTIRLNDSDDPLKSGYSTSTIFRVSALEHPITIDEINNILSKARDTDNGKVPYEIISIQADNKSFIVAARIKTPRNFHSSIFVTAHGFRLTENLERHGMIIRCELEKYFPKESIVSLEDYLNGDEIWTGDSHWQDRSFASTLSNFVSGVFGAFSFPRWYSSGSSDNKHDERERSKKRRRVSFHASSH